MALFKQDLRMSDNEGCMTVTSEDQRVAELTIKEVLQRHISNGLISDQYVSPCKLFTKGKRRSDIAMQDQAGEGQTLRLPGLVLTERPPMAMDRSGRFTTMADLLDITCIHWSAQRTPQRYR